MFCLEQIGTKDGTHRTFRLKEGPRGGLETFAFPPDVIRLHIECSDGEVRIGDIVFLPKVKAEETRCFAVEFISLVTVRWYAWNESDDNVLYSDGQAKWIASGQSFAVFMQNALQSHWKQRQQNEMRYREKCVNGRYVPSPELLRPLEEFVHFPDD